MSQVYHRIVFETRVVCSKKSGPCFNASIVQCNGCLYEDSRATQEHEHIQVDRWGVPIEGLMV